MVVNVEAASLYEDPARFFAEVERVLRPGGMFLFADLCFPHEVAGLRAALAASGLQMVDEDDIAGNVSHGLELDAARRPAAVREIVPWPLRGLAKVFVRRAWDVLSDALRVGAAPLPLLRPPQGAARAGAR